MMHGTLWVIEQWLPAARMRLWQHVRLPNRSQSVPPHCCMPLSGLVQLISQHTVPSRLKIPLRPSLQGKLGTPVHSKQGGIGNVRAKNPKGQERWLNETPPHAVTAVRREAQAPSHRSFSKRTFIRMHCWTKVSLYDQDYNQGKLRRLHHHITKNVPVSMCILMHMECVICLPSHTHVNLCPLTSKCSPIHRMTTKLSCWAC